MNVVASPVQPNGIGRRYWLLLAAAGLVPAVLVTVRSVVFARFGGEGPITWQDLLFNGSDWLVLGAVTPITYFLARRFPLRREALARTLAAHLGGVLAFGLAWASLGLLIGLLLHHYPGNGDVARNYGEWIFITLPVGALVYLGVLAGLSAIGYALEARRRQAQEASLAAQLAEARLGALRMQLNPHFLFNSLNAIAVLVRDQRTRDASRMLELLGGVLRHVLRAQQRQEVPLEEELGFLEQYLAIEQVRFSDRLVVRWLIEPQVRDALVPELVLQPLVENAIRHGIARRGAAGALELAARAHGDELVLTVRDDGPGYDAAAAATGVGLANTRARLETLYGGAASLDVREAEGGGTIATVRLPLRRGPGARHA